MSKVYGYARVSTELQADGASIDTQKQQIKAYCEYKKLTDPIFFCDIGASGKSVDRPKLNELRKLLQEGDTIIVAELSRMGRNTSDFLALIKEFEARKIKFVCLSPELDASTPSGKMMFTVMMSMHTFEREQVAKKVKDNMQRLSKEKKLRTRPMFGYRFVSKTKHFEEDKDQQAVVREILERNQAGQSLNQIAKELTREGKASVLRQRKKLVTIDGKRTRLVDPRPRCFHAQQIKNIIRQYSDSAYLKRNPNRVITIHDQAVK